MASLHLAIIAKIHFHHRLAIYFVDKTTADISNLSPIGDLTIRISVDYDPPADFNPGPNEYRAASGPVAVTCTATGTGTGPVSYRWSSTCRSCPFQTATTSSIFRAAVHSGDTGTHTCVATRGGSTASASIAFRVVGESGYL